MKGMREWSKPGFAAYRRYFLVHPVFPGKDVPVRKKAPPSRHLLCLG